MTDGDRYRRKLLLLLSSATFFEGYDTFVLAFVLALILGDLGGSEADAGWIRDHAAQPVAGFLLAGQADRIGRKRLLLITIVGYTATTALTAVSPGLIWLTVARFGAQGFLGAEWAVAITIVVEEFPREHRGQALGIVTSMNTLGGIFVGVLAIVGLQDLGPGWRSFFLVGLIPGTRKGPARWPALPMKPGPWRGREGLETSSRRRGGWGMSWRCTRPIGRNGRDVRGISRKFG